MINAWGKHLDLKNKDTFNNLTELLYTRAIFLAQKPKFFLHQKIADSIKKWDCPSSHTLNEVFFIHLGEFYKKIRGAE